MQLLKGKRIFYIEDNPRNLALTQLLLEKYGAQVKFERWGVEDLINRLQSFTPDIILLDLMFPKNISGYDIFDMIRSHAELGHIPIVAVSAADPSLEMPKAREKGFAGYIGKPLNLMLFPKQIASIIEGEKIWFAG